MIVSIHIPKTAGTTLASILDYAVDRQILYDYRGLVPADRDEQIALRPFLSRFQVIHGHFQRFVVGERHRWVDVDAGEVDELHAVTNGGADCRLVHS